MKFAYITLLLLLAAACTKQEAPQAMAVQRTPVRLNARIDAMTYLSTGLDFTTTFESGDRIGVFVVGRAKGESKAPIATGNYADNVTFVFNGTGWTVAGELFYPTSADSVLDFYAYYPWNEYAFAHAYGFGVHGNQYSDGGYNVGDLLWACATAVDSGVPVTLDFAHKMALVEVKISNAATAPDSLWMLNVNRNVVLDVSDGTLDEVADPAEIIMHPVGDTIFRALIPAQDFPANTTLFRLDYENDSATFDLPSAASFTAGNAFRYTIDLTPTLP